MFVAQEPGAFRAAPGDVQHELAGVVWAAQAPPHGSLEDAAAQVTVHQIRQYRLASGVGQLNQPALLPQGLGRLPGRLDLLIPQASQIRPVSYQHG